MEDRAEPNEAETIHFFVGKTVEQKKCNLQKYTQI